MAFETAALEAAAKTSEFLKNSEVCGEGISPQLAAGRIH
jgi:hypothetical protein